MQIQSPLDKYHQSDGAQNKQRPHYHSTLLKTIQQLDMYRICGCENHYSSVSHYLLEVRAIFVNRV